MPGAVVSYMTATPNLGEFVDTNVLVYAFDGSPQVAGRRLAAQELVARLWETRSGCLSTQVLQEFFAVSTRKIKVPMSTEQAYSVVETYAAWAVHRPTPADVLDAIQLHQQHQIAFWDALIIRSAQAMNCRVLWSEDLTPGQVVGELTIRNPFA